MNIKQIIEFILSTEVDVSESFLYRMVEEYGEAALAEWVIGEYVTTTGGDVCA